MIVRIGFGLLAWTVLAAAQPAPGNTKTVKEEKGRCEAVVPAEATVVIPYMAQGPASSYSVVLDRDGEPYKTLTAADLQQFHYSKAIENTPARLILEKESHAVSPGYRVFHVYLPLKDGRCHVGISFKSSVSEEAMKRIAASAKLIR